MKTIKEMLLGREETIYFCDTCHKRSLNKETIIKCEQTHNKQICCQHEIRYSGFDDHEGSNISKSCPKCCLVFEERWIEAESLPESLLKEIFENSKEG